MMRLVLLGLLALGANAQGCPQPEIRSNSTSCLMVGDNKCDKRYTVIKFQGKEQAIPCEFNRRTGLCNNRLDCAFDVPECPSVEGRRPSNFGSCGANRGQKQCEKSYQQNRMTGAYFRFPCRWLDDKCVWRKDCAVKVVPTMKPTMAPSEDPTSIPTRTPTLPPTAPPTRTPTRAPTVQPTEMPTTDFCNTFSNAFKETCLDFGCYYVDETGLCTQDRPWGYDCGTANRKKKCTEDEECEWKGGKCIAGTEPTSAPTIAAFCSELFSNEEECNDWKDFAGCQWDSVLGKCLDYHEDLTTYYPTGTPTEEPKFGCDEYKGRRQCQKFDECLWQNNSCMEAPTDCYVDFETYTLFGLEQIGVTECRDKPKKLNCELQSRNGVYSCVEIPR